MNPFLHPAVATPLDPDDVPVWRPDTVCAVPETVDAPDPGQAAPVGPQAGEHADPASGTMRVHLLRVRRRDAGMSLVGSGRDRRPRGARGVDGSPKGVASCQRRSLWRSRLGSLALVGIVGLGACTGVMAQPAQVNANVATAAELETIKGIGPKTARSIVSERQRSGLFESFQDFSERIRGIGAKRAASLRAAGLVIGPPVSQPHIATPGGPGTSGAPVGVLVR